MPPDAATPFRLPVRSSGQGPGNRFWLPNAKGGESFSGPGLAHGHLHEFYAADADHAAAAAGLVAGIAIMGMIVGKPRSIAWVRSKQASSLHGMIQGAGWVELGGTPEACLFVLADNAIALLRASVDMLRSGGVSVVVMEGRGRMPELDLTASRRLSLAAEKSGALLLLLRSDASPAPSAAETRWSVAAAPSRALLANAPGLPTFDIELLRHRSGPAGRRWRLEWDRDRRIFREAAVSGAVAAVPVCGAAADAGTPAPHADTRHAA